MASEHIGRLQVIGIGAENPAAKGTSVAAEVWTPKTDGSFAPEFESAVNDAAMGVIDEVYSSETTKNRTKVSISGYASDNVLGYLLLGAMGNEDLVYCCTISGHGGTGDPARGDTVSSATGSFTGTIKKLVLIGTTTYYFITQDTGTLSNQTDLTDGSWTGGTVDFSTFSAVKGHFFSRLNTNAHPSFTIYGSDEVGDEKATYCLVDTFDLEIAVGDFAKFTATFIGSQLETASAQSPSFTTDNLFLAKHAAVKFAASESALGAATASSVQNLKLSIAKNLADVQAFGDTDITSIHNQQFGVSGDLEAIYNATTFRDYVANSTKRAMRVSLINSDATVICDATDDIYPAIYVDVMSASFNEWSRSADNNSLVRQTMGFACEFGTDEAATIEILLINTTAALYEYA